LLKIIRCGVCGALAYGIWVWGMRLLKKFASLELPLLLLYCSTAPLLYFLFLLFTPSRFTLSRFFFTLHVFTLHAFTAFFTLHASRFTQKNLPKPSLRKRDFKLWKCFIYGISCCSAALLLFCSSAL